MPAQPNRSVSDALACLQALAASTVPIGSRALARITGFEHTRTNRLLGTLASIGLAEQDASRKYRPGAGIHVLAALSLQSSGLLASALPCLDKLRVERLMVALGVLWKRHVCYIFSARPGEGLKEAVGRHELFPVENSSIGLAVLAGGDEKTVGDFIACAKAAGTPFDVRRFLGELETVRRLGYAVVSRTPGDASIGAAIGSPPLAGVAVAGKVKDKSIPELAEKVAAAARSITAAMQGG